MPFNLQLLEAGEGSFGLTNKKRKQGFEGGEPRSVLDSRRSPSPPTSSSTLSSSLCGSDTAGVAALSAAAAATDAPWASDLHPIPADMGAEDWEAILSMPPPISPSQEQTFLQWFMADSDNFDGGVADAGFGIDPIGALGGGFSSMIGNTAKAPAFFPAMEEKPPLFGPGGVVNHLHQSQPAPIPAFFAPAQTLGLPPQPRRYHPAGEPCFQVNCAPLYQLQQRPINPKPAAVAVQQQQQALVDQLFKAAELLEAGSPVTARGILARLNQQLPAPVGKPLLRSAFYFKEALGLIATGSPPRHRTQLSPLDVVVKLGTYNDFSEVSPIVQFTNFTSIQAVLEELGGSARIHIIDFDIGVGGQWSSFMQELAQRRSSCPMLKITAFVSASSHHPLELHLTRENLAHFASDLNIPFEFNALSIDPLDPAMLLGLCSMEEAVAVNLPVNCAYHLPPQMLIRLLKQLSPKIVVSVDNGCDRFDLPFSHQFLHAFQACTVLLDSIDAAGTNPDVCGKIERYLLQPRIENALMGRSTGDRMVPWRTLFASAGFVPVQFSNFTETQAECLLKKVQVRGFNVEKRQGSLFLCWQHGELVSVAAWRC